MNAHRAIDCPNCGELDAVRKASALYEGGSRTTTYEQPVIYGNSRDGYYTVMEEQTVTSRTALARKLAPPPKPGVTLSIVGFAFAWGIISLFVGLIITPWFFRDPTQRSIPVEGYWTCMGG